MTRSVVGNRWRGWAASARFCSMICSTILALLAPLTATSQAKKVDANIARTTVKAVIKSIPQFDPSWKIYILNEAQWKEFRKKWGSQSQSDWASTALDVRITFLRESFVLNAPPQTLRHVLWHEAGHISCRCRSEQIANQFAFHHE